jgi:hypothetical protein
VKIEMGESLMRSWLRHVTGCQLAELNWKPSLGWEKSGDGQQRMDAARVFFQRALTITLFANDANASQLLRQAEVDVLGVKLSPGGKVEAVYAADIAYHENGLHYKDDVGRILKKLVRGRIAVEAYFGEVPCHVVFASPVVRPGPLQALRVAMEQLRAFFAKQRLATTTTFYANAAFRDDIILPTLAASAETADSSELFLRSYRLLAGFALAGTPAVTSGIADAPAAERGESLGLGLRAGKAANAACEPVKEEVICRWASDPSLKVHRIVAIAVQLTPLTRQRLVAEICRAGLSRDARGAVASLMSNGGKNYGLVFTASEGSFGFHPDIEALVRAQSWQVG